jgi:hypothetical protein
MNGLLVLTKVHNLFHTYLCSLDIHIWETCQIFFCLSGVITMWTIAQTAATGKKLFFHFLFPQAVNISKREN